MKAAAPRLAPPLPDVRPIPVRAALAGILLLALLTRLGFLALAPVVYGDAVSYSWVAWLTARGELGQVDTFWHSLFDFWQALLILAGLERWPALVAASLIPGTLLVIPVYLTARRLYGTPAGLIAALFAALHPRLVEYSVNGYSESFYLCAAAWGLWGLTALLQEPARRGPALVAGAGLAGYFLVRNETILLLAALGAAGLLVGLLKDRRLLRGLLTAGITLAVLTGAYVGLTWALWDTTGLFAKSSNVGKRHVETLDLAAAARETYGAAGSQPVPAAAPGGLPERVAVLAERWPRNLAYAAQRLPGVLMSPLVLFALALPFLAPGWPRLATLPLLAFTLWPLAFYPLLQLEPRLLFLTLIGVLIYAAAGLAAAGRLLARRLAPRRPLAARRLTPIAVALLALALLPPGLVLARHSEAQRGFHREIGAWLAHHLPAGTPVAGDGYGWVSASTFWAGIRGEPRRWTDDPAALAAWVRERGFPVLILYEGWLRGANPELLAVLDAGLPGMETATRFQFHGAGRVAVFVLPGSVPSQTDNDPGARP